MEVVGTLGVILLVSFLVESLVEAVLGMPIDLFARLQPYKTVILKTMAFAAGVASAIRVPV